VQGGAQERQRRAGTENVAGIVGFARALELAQGDPEARDKENARLAGLRDRLIAGITAIEGVELSGHPTERLANSASFLVAAVEGGDLVAGLDLEGVAASTGSACTTGSTEPSHVLLAMGISAERAHGSLRLTAGRDTTVGDVDRAIEGVATVVARLRAGGAALHPAAVHGAPA
jgi:cysteine desulfurase